MEQAGLVPEPARERATSNQSRKGNAVRSAWKTRHDLAEDACPECQGSAYVPAPENQERIVNECPICEGSGKDETKQAA